MLYLVDSTTAILLFTDLNVLGKVIQWSSLAAAQSQFTWSRNIWQRILNRYTIGHNQEQFDFIRAFD